MLVAMTEQQQMFQLTSNLPQQEIQLLKQRQAFYCPQCKDLLMLKAGQIKIPHFAHRKNSECDSMFSEGESAAHLLGKQHLFHLLEQLQLQPVLEPYLPHLRQRPDLLISMDDRHYAIEFQCSPISSEQFQQRTNGYLQASIIPTWLPHTPEKFKQAGMMRVSINHTHAQFIQQYKHQQFLVTYDPLSQTFYYISNLVHLHKLQYIAVIKPLPIEQQRFPFLIPEILCAAQFHALLLQFRQYRDHYMRPRLLLSKKGVSDRFLRALYGLGFTPASNLPNFLGIPVYYTNAFNIYCLEWQVELFYFMKCHALIPETMNVQAIPYFLEWSQMEPTEERKQAAAHYLNILKRLQIQQVHEKVDANYIFDVLYDELVAIG